MQPYLAIHRMLDGWDKALVIVIGKFVANLQNSFPNPITPREEIEDGLSIWCREKIGKSLFLTNKSFISDGIIRV